MYTHNYEKDDCTKVFKLKKAITNIGWKHNQTETIEIITNKYIYTWTMCDSHKNHQVLDGPTKK